MRDGDFPSPDDVIDEAGRARAQALVLKPAPERIVVAPSPVARQTVEAMGLNALVDPALADIDHGAWRGRSLAQIQASTPEALMGWIADPAVGAPGGETFDAVQARVSAWVEEQASADLRILAVTHQPVMRAALAHVLQIPPSAAFRIDIAPLSLLTLSFNRQWRFQGLSVGPEIA